nr:MAG TPA: hypothetical protein [Caudoviricetes sp.]
MPVITFAKFNKNVFSRTSQRGVLFTCAVRSEACLPIQGRRRFLNVYLTKYGAVIWR